MSYAKKILRTLSFSGCLLTAGSNAADGWIHDTPITPNASVETRALLAFLGDNYGKFVISGQQEGRLPRSGESYEFNYIRSTTGKLPALRSFDLLHLTTMRAPFEELEATRRAKHWYAHSNGIVSFCWHWPAPNGSGKFYAKETWFDLEKALVAGTTENTALRRDLDIAAAQLKILRDAHVPVLWRPLHENNGRWFWWGDHSPKALRELWQLMYHRFTDQHALTNLLWVFSPGAATDLSDWYPGDAYVDLIGYDHYTMEPTLDPAKKVFNELNTLVAGRKMLAMSENGHLPDLDRIFTEKAVWSFFTTWSGDMISKTPTKQFAAIYNDARVLTVDELPDLKKHPSPAAGSATKLVFVAPQQIPVNGPATRPITVVLQDKDGLSVRENGRVVTLTAAGKIWTAKTFNGIATFADAKFDQPTNKLTLTASAAGLASAASGPTQVGPGNGLVLERWENRPFHSLADLRDEKIRMKAPTTPEVLTTEFRVTHENKTNYAARFNGWLIAPVTGPYEFTLISDGSSQLRLAANDAATTRVIAEITPHTPYSKWPHSHEVRSAPVSLVAGKRYPIEVLHVQAAGSSGLTVRWHPPTAAIDEIIPAAQLASAPPDDANAGKPPQLRADRETHFEP